MANVEDENTPGATSTSGGGVATSERPERGERTDKGTLKQPDWAWNELLAFVRAATQTPVRNPLLTT